MEQYVFQAASILTDPRPPARGVGRFYHKRHTQGLKKLLVDLDRLAFCIRLENQGIGYGNGGGLELDVHYGFIGGPQQGEGILEAEHP